MTQRSSTRPSRPPADDGTSVRSRDPEKTGTGTATGVRPSFPPPGNVPTDLLPGQIEQRAGRVDDKVRAAKQMLERLPENDRRRRLLHAAIVRRDEVLLDGLLGELRF